MAPPRKQNPSGLGKAIINRKYKDAQQRRETGNYTTDVDATTRLQSITQERDLDEFLNTAQLAGTEFTAEKQNIRIIQSPSTGTSSAHNPFLLSAQDEKKTLQKHSENKSRLRVPRRPPWTKDMTPVQLDRQERDSFLDWRRGLADLSEKEGLLLTPFERNIEVWRQLWRVLERSQLIVQIVDARNPLQFRCEDLEAYIKDIEGPEGEKGSGPGNRKSLLLINKADLLTRNQRVAWADYFESNGIQFAFYSAANAAALQTPSLPTIDTLNLNEEDSSEPGSEEEPDTPEEDNVEDAPVNAGDPSFNDRLAEETDTRVKVLTVDELEELFIKSAPSLSDFADTEGKSPPMLTVGLVGYPNVGKSSTINSLIGAKKVSVSSTPGKTKHFQTIRLSPTLMLCDCPGLVFPQFATTKAELVCDGVLPIDQMREYRGPVGLVTKRISRAVLEATYGLTIRQRGMEEGGDGSDEVLAEDLLTAYAIARGFARAGQGNPDESRAARYILKDYVNAKLLYCHPSPGKDGKEFNQETAAIQLRQVLGKKKAPTTRVGKNADTAPEVLLGDGTLNESGVPAPPQSAKTRALDREFFESQAVGSRPYVKGGNRDGKAFVRTKLYPHQNSIANDGTPLDPNQARAAAIIEASGIGVGSGKKHFKMKRGKQRSGKGYD
ncbi:putative LSG1-large-subunit GTPase [Serendipita vermifera]|nr:putative LSG1-large-subunit GTPase [Serendipita vermifera]